MRRRVEQRVAHVRFERSEALDLRLREMQARHFEVLRSVALEWSDIDFVKRQVCVQRSAWKAHIASPKGGRLRYVPLTMRLAAALRDDRHLRGRLVLYQDDGSPSLNEGLVQGFVRRSAQKAGVFNSGRTCCVTRSARISRCVARRRARFRSSPAIRI
jgi:integrase